jgi:hypothetical protein
MRHTRPAGGQGARRRRPGRAGFRVVMLGDGTMTRPHSAPRASVWRSLPEGRHHRRAPMSSSWLMIRAACSRPFIQPVDGHVEQSVLAVLDSAQLPCFSPPQVHPSYGRCTASGRH